jgi:dephospho-CoA kinase
VFASRPELDFLESLLHPRVVRAYLAWRDALAALPEPPAVCATEVPLLYETGGETRFDVVVAIGASAEVRLGRTVVPDPTDREQRLLPDEEKLRRADYAYVNDGTLGELDAFIAGVVATLSR